MSTTIDGGQRRREAPVEHLRVLGDPSRHGRAVLVAAHPGALPVDSYQTIVGRLPDGVDAAVFEISTVPEYWHTLVSGAPLSVGIDEIADRFAALILDYVGDRPYVLLGWSFGGVLGYAAAERLAAKAPPAHLLLLDSIAPGPGDPGQGLGNVIPDQAALHWFAMYFGAIRGVRLDFDSEEFGSLDVDQGLERILDRCSSLGAVLPGTSVDGVRKVFDAFIDGMLRHKKLQDGYRPGAPHWGISLVRPQRGLIDGMSTLGWGDLVGPALEIHRCSGDHYTMLADAACARLISELTSAALEHARVSRHQNP